MIDLRFYTPLHPNGAPLSALELLIDGSADTEATLIQGVAPLEHAQPGDVTYLDTRHYLPHLATCKASFCLVTSELYAAAMADQTWPAQLTPLVVTSPKRAWAQLVGQLYTLKAPLASHPIDPSAVIDPSATIGYGCVIGPGVVIGAHTVLEPHVTVIAATIGANCRIGSGTRIGQEGFGFVMDAKGHITLPHLGTVRIEDDVRLGANCCVDRGTLGVTHIGQGCRIDNLVQIAHNVYVGAYCVMASQVGISGSTKIGNFVVIGGQVGVTQHLTIGDKVQIAGQSGVIRDIPHGMVYGGTPAVPITQWRRHHVILQRLALKKGS